MKEHPTDLQTGMWDVFLCTKFNKIVKIFKEKYCLYG